MDHKDKMDVVFCTDNNYVMPCGIAMVSLLENSPNQNIVVHIIGLELYDSTKELLKGIADKYNIRIAFYEITLAFLDNFSFPIEGPKHLTISTYIRLFLSEILPSDIDKILYLDCDLIVTDNISDMWNTDISNYTVAGVVDTQSFSPTIFEKLHYDRKYSYINAGVLLINLKAWREQDIQAKLLEYTNRNKANLVHHDQDIINGTLHASILLLPLKYNVHSFFFRRNFEGHGYQNEIREALKKPAVIHFTTGGKPWKKDSLHPLTHVYLHYKKLSPWANTPIQWSDIPLYKRFKYLKRQIFHALGLKKRRYLTEKEIHSDK